MQISYRITILWILSLLFLGEDQAQAIQTVGLSNYIPDTATLHRLDFEYLYPSDYKALPKPLQASSKRIDSMYHTKSDQFFKIYFVAPEQRAVLDFERYRDTALFEKQVRTFQIDSTLWSKHGINNLVYIQVSKLSDNRYLVIMDANNDFLFDDDTAYFSGTIPDGGATVKDNSSAFNYIPLSNIEFYYGSSHRLGTTVGLNLEVFPKDAPMNDSVSLSVINESLKIGHINNSGHSTTVIIRPSWLSGVNFDKLSEISFLSDGEKYTPGKSYVHLGDTAYANNLKFLVTGLAMEGHELSYRVLSTNDTVIYGPLIGNKAHNFTLPDNQGNTYELSNDSKGKYVLLDFWGTWCHPCLDNIPNLKQYYNQSGIASTVDFIGVCVDELSDKKALIQKIKKLNIPWKSVLVDRNDSYSDNASIVGLYKVTTYPTYIVIDPEGRILFRYSGEDHLQQLLKDLSTLPNSTQK